MKHFHNNIWNDPRKMVINDIPTAKPLDAFDLRLQGIVAKKSEPPKKERIKRTIVIHPDFSTEHIYCRV